MPVSVDPFHAVSLSLRARQLRAQGRSIIHMEMGQPSTAAPSQAIAVAHRILDSDPMGYWESPELKAGLAARYRQQYGVALDPDRFILTCGGSPALVLALASRFDAGDRIAMVRPGYVAYRNTVRALHQIAVEIPCGPATGYQLTAEILAALDPAPDGLIIASPANPTGTIIAPNELAAIAAVCRERGIQIISDEIYHGLSYGEPAHSITEFDPSALVVSSFSKYFSMVGWRVGWLLVPQDHVARARAFAFNLFLTAPSLSQHGALAALDSRAELDAHVATYRRNRDLMLTALPQMGIDRIAPPDGAFYLYADIETFTNDSLSFCRQILEDTGVATAPGLDFDPVEGHHFMRFSFAVSTQETETAITRLRHWFEERRSRNG